MSAAGSNVRVVLFGLGTVGGTVLRLCGMRPWIEVVGAVVSPSGANDDPPDGPDRLTVSRDADSLLDDVSPDVALIATRPSVSEVLPDIERCVGKGVHVICTSEELAFPDIVTKGSGRSIDALARDSGVVVAATGINPGFIFDSLPLTIAGAAWNVQRIHVSRSLDASVFGREVHRSLGVGYDPAGFAESLADRVIRGHIGFEESAHVIANAMGKSVDRFEEKIEPIYAQQAHDLRDYRIEPGQSAGVSQRAIGWSQGDEWIHFDLSLHVAPAVVGLKTHDRIRVEGENPIDVTIEPGTQAVLTTAARVVNSIPAVLAAPPGLHNAVDLLPAAPWLGQRLPLDSIRSR